MIDADGVTAEERVDDEIAAAGILNISAPCSVGALAVDVGGVRAVVCSPDLTEAERTVAKTHELAHFETGTLYPLNCTNRGRAERVAFAACARRLLPYDKLCACAVKLKTLDAREIAEALDLTPAFVSDVEKYYFDVKGRSVPYAEI